MSLGLWVHEMRVGRTRRRLQREYELKEGGRWYPPVPPPSINFNQVLGGSLAEYRKTYTEQSRTYELPFLRATANLDASSVTLDFGCGLGRLANAFAATGPEVGTYLGWEPEPSARAWLQEAYEGRDSFEFGGETLPAELKYVTQLDTRDLARIRNGAVPDGVAWERFLGGRGVDLAWSHSVFTHMWPEDAVANLRLLRDSCNSGAVMVHTWLVIDDFASAQLSKGKADRALPFEVGGIRTLSRRKPLDCTGYPLPLVEGVYKRAGVDISEILYGTWTGRDNGVTYIDMIVSRVP